jgi:phospholipid N-methyltransferase
MDIPENTYKKLLSCNLNNIDLYNDIGIDKIKEQRLLYENLTNNNYLCESPKLSDWYQDTEYVYPNVDKTKQKILDIIKKYKPKSVLEGGSGCGKLSKYVYDILDKDVELICVENNKDYYRQMQTNFSILKYEPKIYIKAKTILGSLHNIKEIKDNSIDLVFTHTVLMHMPFTAVIETVYQLARISSKYILHVENKNDIESCVYPKNTYPEYNKVMINYIELYNELGFETILYEEELLDDGSHVITFLGKRL